MCRQEVKINDEVTEAAEHACQDTGHDSRRFDGVFLLRRLEHGDAVGNGFDAGHGTTAVSKGPQDDEHQGGLIQWGYRFDSDGMSREGAVPDLIEAAD